MDECDSCTYQVFVKSCSDHSPNLASNSLRKVSNFLFLFYVASGHFMYVAYS